MSKPVRRHRCSTQLLVWLCFIVTKDSTSPVQAIPDLCGLLSLLTSSSLSNVFSVISIYHFIRLVNDVPRVIYVGLQFFLYLVYRLLYVSLESLPMSLSFSSLATSSIIKPWVVFDCFVLLSLRY